MTSVSKAIRDRRSIRAYTDKPVDPVLLRSILSQASRAPSGSNLQPWHIHIVAGQSRDQLIDKIESAVIVSPEGETEQYPLFPPDLAEPYFSRRSATAAGVYKKLGVKRQDHTARMLWRGSNFKFFGAPVGLFCYIDKDFGPGQWSDLGMFLQNVMLLARENGLDTCAQEAWALYNETVSKFLGVSNSNILFCGMAIGYADLDSPVNDFLAPRATLEDFTTFHGI